MPPVVSPKRVAEPPRSIERPTAVSPTEMALDTLASFLRILAEHATDQDEMDAATFARLCEQWAQHVLVAAPAPSGETATIRPADDRRGVAAARRDWAGLKEFVRDHSRISALQTRTTMSDLRQVIWVFIQNLNQTVAQDQETDARVKQQLGRLEELARGPSTGDLKREVLSTVVAVSQVLDERKKRQTERVAHLGAQVQSLGSELETARKESEVDPVTRLYNRRAFDEYLDRTVELSRAFGTPGCMLLIDVDRFKTINDTFGHATGDAVLRTIADRVSRVFLRKNDFVARYGGDELAVILRETTLQEARGLADRLLAAIRGASLDREGTHVSITASIGLCQLGANDSAEKWLERTDRALYQAKKLGRDRAVEAIASQI